MRNIVCPKCNAVGSVLDQETRMRVKCVGCGYQISLLDAETYNPKRHKKKKPSPYLYYLYWLPALVILGIGIASTAVSFFWERGVWATIVIEAILLVAAVVWAAKLAAQDGSHAILSDLYSSEDESLANMIILMSLGAGALFLMFFPIYIIYLYFILTQLCIGNPRRYLPVLAAQAVALFFLILAFPVSMIGARVLVDR